MNHGCISADVSSQEFPLVRLKDIQVKEHWRLLTMGSTCSISTGFAEPPDPCQPRVRQNRASYHEFTQRVPHTATDDRHLQHTPSELKFLLSRGTHQDSAKHLWNPLSTRHQLGPRAGFSPTAWFEAENTAGFLNPWLC